MMGSKLHKDADADRLWRRCRKDADLRWLLEGVLSSRTPALGRMLLLSPLEFFGQVQAKVGKKLSLLFHLTGFPYLSGGLKELSGSLRQMAAGRRPHVAGSGNAQRTIEEWKQANGREALDLLAAAILETVRKNPVLRQLAASDEPITNVQIARQVAAYEALDWTAMEKLVQIFEPFLARPKSKKPINRLTLDFTSLLAHLRPEISQLDLALRSAEHFTALLEKRRVNEAAWRDAVMMLISRDLLIPYTPMFLWCRSYPAAGFVASLPFSAGPLPPLCPACGQWAHAIASYAPASGFDAAVRLRDGVLGAAVGWHLTKRGVKFWHSHQECGTEVDFIAKIGNQHVLIECKMLSVTVADQQLRRNLREAADQLDSHTALLEHPNWKLRESVCLVNLTERHLDLLRTSNRQSRATLNKLISYEQFPAWFRSRWHTAR